MTQLIGSTMGMMHVKVLVEVDWIKHGYELYSYQHLVLIVGFGFDPGRAMTTQPLEKRLVFLRRRAFQVHVVHPIVVCLAGEGRTEQKSHLVCPADFDVGQGEDHLRFQGGYCSKEGVGRLISSDVGAV